ncbi:MAG: DUF6259 domain-containing protein [Kiritimatiellia bacterium]|nr:DUF6259 domain-containing protein [Kiritimatiellia bacterium]
MNIRLQDAIPNRIIRMALVLLCMHVTQSANASNIIINGDFENNLTGWTSRTMGGSSVEIAESSLKSMGKSILMNGKKDTSAYIQQNFTLQGDLSKKAIKVSCRVYREVPGEARTGIVIVGRYADGKPFSAYPCPFPQTDQYGRWILLEGVWTPEKPVTEAGVRAFIEHYNGRCWFDDVNVLIEPSAGSNVQQNTNFIIEDANLRIGFSKDDSLVSIQSLYDKQNNYEYLSPLILEGIWRVLLKKADGDMVVLSGEDQCEFSKTITDNTLLLCWDKFLEYQGLKINVTVKLKQKPWSQSEWNITVDNTSKTNSIMEVIFPIVPNIAPLGEESDDDNFAYPRGIGRLCKNPMRNLSFGTVAYPSWLCSAQFFSYFDDQRGLYLACHDKDGYFKNFSFSKDFEHSLFNFSIKHFPENIGVAGNSLRSPYVAVIAPTAGNWMDAAMRYREWTLARGWCSKIKPLAHRKDFSSVLKNCGLMVCWSLQGGIGEAYPLYRGITDALLNELSDFFKVPIIDISVNTYPRDRYNARYVPREEVPQILLDAKKHNVDCMPWTSALRAVADTNNNDSTWNADELYVVVGLDGNKCILPSQNFGLGTMCMASKYWHERMANWTVRLLKDGFSGVYYDELTSTAVQMCYSKTHGHPVGGGSWGCQMVRQGLQMIRKKAKEVNPDFFCVSEECGEYVIGLNDAHWTFGSRYIDNIPLWNAVYHDYAVTFGRQKGKFYHRDGSMNLYTAQSGYVNLDEFYVIAGQCHPTELVF